MAKSDREKRVIILDAAEALLPVRRVHELTMEDVAEAAGVSKGTIYTHFKNKEDLLFQIATRGFEELCELAASDEGFTDFHVRLVRVCEKITAFFKKRRAVLTMIQEHEGRIDSLSRDMQKRWKEKRKELIEAIARVLTQGVEEHFVRPELDVNLLATFLLGMLRSRGRDFIHTPNAQPSVAFVADLFLHGAACHSVMDINAREQT